MKHAFPYVLACVAAAFAMTFCASRPLRAEQSEAALTEANFQRLHDTLQPGNEPWRTIPWRIALLDAQRAAAEQNKPIFIWAMDGHPLGCT